MNSKFCFWEKSYQHNPEMRNCNKIIENCPKNKVYFERRWAAFEFFFHYDFDCFDVRSNSNESW